MSSVWPAPENTPVNSTGEAPSFSRKAPPGVTAPRFEMALVAVLRSIPPLELAISVAAVTGPLAV
jgi:hypothetical protein